MFKLIYLLLLKISFSFSACITDQNHCTKCDPIAKLCIKCEKDIYIPDEFGGCEYSHKCILGVNNCLECNDSGNLCLKCIEGYFPDENGGCSYTDNCEISYKGKCLKCKENFVLIGEERKHDKEKEIKFCKSLLFGDLKNCEKIDLSSGLCEKCKEGYFLTSEEKKCILEENCSESIFDICVKCDNYYYLDKKEGKCIKQKDQFENCKETVDGKTCEVCDDGFYFDEDKNCIEVNFCLKGMNGFICIECLPGYYLNNYINNYFCTKTDNCFYGDKDIGICTECSDGFYLDYTDRICK